MKYHEFSGSASGSVVSGQNKMWFALLTAGSSNGTVVFTDSTDGSGTQKYEISAPANTTSSPHDLKNIGGVWFEKGIYATVTGGARFRVYYE